MFYVLFAVVTILRRDAVSLDIDDKKQRGVLKMSSDWTLASSPNSRYIAACL